MLKASLKASLYNQCDNNNNNNNNKKKFIFRYKGNQILRELSTMKVKSRHVIIIIRYHLSQVFFFWGSCLEAEPLDTHFVKGSSYL